MMGGQRIGNPHQILHDAEVPSLIGITAVRYSFTDVPTYGQGTLAQIQTDMANAPITNDPTRMFSRLYLTTANPYVQGVATPHNNYQTYQGILSSASAASFQLTAADDGKMYAFKTLSAPNQQSMNILIKELPNSSQFKGSTDLKGGATGVHVTQNGDAAALSAYMATLKPYDFSWRAALAPYANDPNTGAFVANWVMGSHQVQAYQLGMQNQSAQTGNEAFGVLAWDANQNKYVMLDPTNMQATAGNVTGNMPTLGANQFGFFGMHTHPGSATPSNQDNLMTQQLGLDQMVIGTNGTTAIMTNNPGNQWQGAGFEFHECGATKSCGSDTKIVVSGNRVVGGANFAHGEIQVTNGYDVRIIEGQPRLGYSNVLTLVNATNGMNRGEAFTFSITSPDNRTLNQLGNDLIQSAISYQNNLSYTFPSLWTQGDTLNGGYNSNSFFMGVLKATGITDTTLLNIIATAEVNGWRIPGAENPVTGLSSYNSSWSTSASTYNSNTGDSNHAPGTSYSSHVNGF
jgi:hypothetical protein